MSHLTLLPCNLAKSNQSICLVKKPQNKLNKSLNRCWMPSVKVLATTPPAFRL